MRLGHGNSRKLAANKKAEVGDPVMFRVVLVFCATIIAQNTKITSEIRDWVGEMDKIRQARWLVMKLELYQNTNHGSILN